MYKTPPATNRKPQRPTHAECCTDGECPSGLRNRYFVGKQLTPDALRIEQDYLNERRHLINRAIHGWGVAYGFSVSPAAQRGYEKSAHTGRLAIGPGFALDEPGRELVQTKTVELEFDDVLVLGEKDGRIDDCRPDDCWLLSAHYAEQDVGPVDVSNPCNCTGREWNQVCETVKYSLRRIDCMECCDAGDCAFCCECSTGPCCAEDPNAGTPDRGEVEPGCTPNPVKRGGCQCLCDYLTGLEPPCGGDHLCELVQPCWRGRIDVSHGVPLACVGLCRDETCGDWRFDHWADPCGPRRLVKSNEVLFDLLRGCDLTRIKAIGWADWHRSETPVPWHQFLDSFGTDATPDKRVTRNYWVEFSRPVRKSTLRTDCFTMTVWLGEAEGGWRGPLRVPIVDLITVDSDPRHATRAVLVVDSSWIDDALCNKNNRFRNDIALVEIEVRGDYLIDCNGQRPDLNAVGLSPAPTGNGTPGGTFLSTFRVAEWLPPNARPTNTHVQSQGA